MTDRSIEIPPKKNPPPLAVLARQIEAIKNDVTPEKLKTVEPRLSKLSERITILKNSRSERVDELAKINEEFEKIREELEIQNFSERFAASEKVAQFLQENPKKKIADLKSTDFPKIEILQNPDEWENILGDVKKSLTVPKILENNKFDWNHPKDSLVKMGGETSKKIWSAVEEHPYLVAGCLVAGTYALYQFLKKNSGIWDKTKGVIAAGVGTWLGFSIFGSRLPQNAAEAISNHLVGPETTQTIKDGLKKGGSVLDNLRRGAERKKDYLKEKLPYSSKNIENLYQNLTHGRLIESGKNIAGLFESLKKENGRAILEIAADGTVTILLFALGTTLDAAVFSFKTTLQAGAWLEDYLLKSENPWINGPTRLIVKVDKYLAATGVAIGTVKSIRNLFTKKGVGHRGIIKTPIFVAKGAAKGLVVEHGKIVKRLFQIRRWSQMARYYQSATKLGAQAVAEYPIRASYKKITNFHSLEKYDLARGEYYLRKIELLKEMERNSIWRTTAEKRELHNLIEKAETSAHIRRVPSAAISKAKSYSGGVETPKTTPTPKTAEHPKVINLSEKRAQRVKPKAPKAKTELRQTQQLKPKPQTNVAETPKLRLVKNPEFEMSAETYEEYAAIIKNSGKKPMLAEEMSAKYEQVARAGKGFVKVLGALGVCLMIQRVAEAGDKRQALIETGSEIAVFTGALRLTPGHPAIKFLAAIAATVGYEFLPKNLIKPIQRKIANLAPDWINNPVLDDFWHGLDYWSGGGVVGLLSNKFSLGENPEEFLKRDIPAYFGDWYNPLTWRIGRMKLNRVADWNRRNNSTIEALDKQIEALQKSLTIKSGMYSLKKMEREINLAIKKKKTEIALRKSLVIDEKWDRSKALKLKMLEGAARSEKDKLETAASSASETDREIVQQFFAKKIIEKSRKNRNSKMLREFVAKINKPELRKLLEKYAGLQINHDEQLEFVKSIERYDKNWEKPEWILQH